MNVPLERICPPRDDTGLLPFSFSAFFYQRKALCWDCFNFPKIFFLLHLVNRTVFRVLYNKLVFIVESTLKVFDAAFCFSTS